MTDSWTANYIRHPLIRAVTTSALRQSEPALTFDHNIWYTINTEKLTPNLRELVKVLTYDESAQSFLSGAYAIPYTRHVFDNVMSMILSPFLSQTARNGVLQRGVMHVASKQQFSAMLGHPEAESPPFTRLLDIGAGDGYVTANLAHLFKEVYATETCGPMRYQLTQKGYKVVEVEGWQQYNYDVITCLNVLDRCDNPVGLLQDMYNTLSKEGGTAIIALVLPYYGMVENVGNWGKQKNFLNITGLEWEDQVSSFINVVLHPMGFITQTISRVPYLCTGDLYAPYYSLDDSLISCTVPKKVNDIAIEL